MPAVQQDFQRLPLLAKTRLALEILGVYARVRWGLRRSELPRLVEDLRRVSGQPPAILPDGSREGTRLAAAVVRTLEAVPPLDSRCLTRSLVLIDLLARRGVQGQLVIAVRPQELLALAAHAWVEVDGRALLEPAGADHARMVTL